MKHIYSQSLTARVLMLLLLACFSMPFWAQDFTKDGVNYYISGETAYVGVSSEATGDVAILDKITVDGKQYPVTVIENSAFTYTTLTSVIIPNSVLRIEGYAFNNCQDLKTVTIGSGVIYIGYDAFYCAVNVEDVYMYADPEALDWSEEGGCDDFMTIEGRYTICHVSNAAAWTEKFAGIVNLIFRDETTVPISFTYDEATQTLTISGTETMPKFPYTSNRPWDSYSSVTTRLVIEDGVPNISPNAFCYFKNLTDITIPSSVRAIGYHAFSHCYELPSITIPASVVKIENALAFAYNSKMTAINVASDNPVYKSIDGVLYTKDGTELFCCPTGKASVSISDAVTSIGSYSFICNEKLTSIALPASVEEIGDEAFYGCKSLTSINLPENLYHIGYRAFSYCSGLTSITIPDGVQDISSYVFENCTSLRTATIGNGIEVLTNNLFSSCYSLATVNLGSSVREFRDDTFVSCSALKTFHVSKDNPYIMTNGDGNIYSKDVTTLVKVPTGLTSITIPASVTRIGDDAAYYCCLTSVNVPDNVTYIGYNAFRQCVELKTASIGSGVTFIGSDAFYSCIKVTDVYCYADPDALEWIDGGYDEFDAANVSVCHVFDAAAYKAKWSTGDTSTDVLVNFQGDLLPQVGTAELVGTNLTTYYNGTNNVKVDAGTQVFKVAFNGSQLSATEVEDRIIKAGEGVILKSQGKTIAMATTTEESSADYSDNSLDGVDVETSKPVGYHYYTLSEYNGDLVFVEIPGTKLLAHKAYLKATSSPYAYYFDDTTGINEIGQQTTDNRQLPIYNLSGQRLNKMQKGINIVGGRKVLVK